MDQTPLLPFQPSPNAGLKALLDAFPAVPRGRGVRPLWLRVEWNVINLDTLDALVEEQQARRGLKIHIPRVSERRRRRLLLEIFHTFPTPEFSSICQWGSICQCSLFELCRMDTSGLHPHLVHTIAPHFVSTPPPQVDKASNGAGHDLKLDRRTTADTHVQLPWIGLQKQPAKESHTLMAARAMYRWVMYKWVMCRSLATCGGVMYWCAM